MRNRNKNPSIRPNCSAAIRHALIMVMLAVSTAYTTTANALPEDQQQPIEIQADFAELDENKGIALYRGDVILTQGTLRIEAEVLTLYSGDEGVEKAMATGNPARYTQTMEADKTPVSARAQQINYLTTQDKLILIDDALIVQEGNRFEGNRIEYNISKQVLNAAGDGENSTSGRVRMTLPPARNTQDTE